MEYVHNARQLHFLISDRISGYAKKAEKEHRFRHFVRSVNYYTWNSPIFLSQMVYQYCCLANGERDPIKRLGYLNKASQNLTLLEIALQNMYSRFRSLVKPVFITMATDKIDFEKKLLVGCKEYVRNVGCI